MGGDGLRPRTEWTSSCIGSARVSQLDQIIPRLRSVWMTVLETAVSQILTLKSLVTIVLPKPGFECSWVYRNLVKVTPKHYWNMVWQMSSKHILKILSDYFVGLYLGQDAFCTSAHDELRREEHEPTLSNSSRAQAEQYVSHAELGLCSFFIQPCLPTTSPTSSKFCHLVSLYKHLLIPLMAFTFPV